MNKAILFTWLVFIFLLQVFVLNNINFFGYVNPYLYISSFLGCCFFYGLGIDFFSDTGGIHAFSLLFAGYFRLMFLRIFFKKTQIDYLLFSFQKESFGLVFNYVVTLTFIHHFILISLDNFNFQDMGSIFLNTFYSGSFTLILYFLGSYLFRKKQIG